MCANRWETSPIEYTPKVHPKRTHPPTHSGRDRGLINKNGTRDAVGDAVGDALYSIEM